jgi:SET domain-containing protein
MMIIRDTSNRGKGLFLFESAKSGENLFGLHEVNFFKHINHSCEPNCSFRRDGRFFFVHADRDLQPDDELTLDYNQIPFRCSPLDFDCHCGSPNCRGHISL